MNFSQKMPTTILCSQVCQRNGGRKNTGNSLFKLHLKGSGYQSVSKGFKEAMHRAGSNDLIFVGGSTFVVAEII